MTLNDLLQTPQPLEQLRSLWLVFPAQLVPALDTVQEPNAKIRVSPILLNDGRYFLGADLLSEINGGMYAATFAKLHSSNFGAVEVIDTAALQLLLVVTPEEEEV